MALRSKSLFLYGFEITTLNQALDFKTSSGGPIYQATIPIGFYSLTSLSDAIASQMRSVDTSHSFTCSVNRNVNGGLENHVTISSTSAYLSLLFGTGPRNATSIASLIGFTGTDKTGATSYTGTTSAGTVLVPEWYGKSWQPPELFRRNFGAVSVSTSGEKEAIVYAVQQFMSVQFDFESSASAFNNWPNFINWMIKQRPFDFTPEISVPGTVYDVTLEKSVEDGKGLAFRMSEMLPQYPFMFSTGLMTFRRRGSF